MRRRVAIAACGMTKFSKSDIPVESVLSESAIDLFGSCSNFDKSTVDSVLVSSNSNTKYLSQILSEKIGIKPKIAHTVESLCNSGTNAIVSAYSYIVSGLADAILVSGADRYDSPGQVLDWDESRGEFKHPIYWASIFTRSYKRRYSVTDDDLAVIPVKNHKQAASNPHALSKKTVSIDDVKNSKRLTEDIRLHDCSRPCTGGASVLLASKEKSCDISDSPVWITGVGQKTTSAGFTKNLAFDSLESTRIAARDALKMSRQNASKVDVAEVHDAFSVCEPMALESIGLAVEGKGTDFAKNLHDTGNFMINPRGGLIGSGHPLGATGIAQAVEITRQLQEKAEKRQVDNPEVGMIHNMAAAATSSTVLVLER